jgi:F-type H+-transporting ATPase subunit a
MNEHHSFTFLSQLPGLEHVPVHVVHGVFVGVLLIALMAVARFQLSFAMKKTEGALIPSPKVTYRNVFEIVAEKLYGLCESVMGAHDAKIYFPFIGTLFVFIFTCNMVGLIPGFSAATDNLNTTLALGVFVFIYYNVMGIKVNGVVGHLKHFMGPVWWLAPLMFVIEIVSHIIRPISLAFRLRWNMTGDHIVLGVFSSLVPYFLPIVFMVLGAFVAFVQAFVFSLMTMVYISMSTAHDH